MLSKQPEGSPFSINEARHMQGQGVESSQSHKVEAVNFYETGFGRTPEKFTVEIPLGAYGQIDGAMRLKGKDGQPLPDAKGATLLVNWSHEKLPNGTVQTEYKNKAHFAQYVTIQTKDKTETREKMAEKGRDRFMRRAMLKEQAAKIMAGKSQSKQLEKD